MGDHEAPKQKRGGLRELLDSKEALRPLVERCRKGRISRAVARREALDPRLTAAYDSPLDHAQEFARRVAHLSVREALRFKKALGLLCSNKDDGVRALTKARMDVKGEGVYEALLLQSWMLRYDDPRLMCHLAKVAVEICDNFDPETYGDKRVADLRARAWGELGNAYRVANRYREAEEAFGTAFSCLLKGSGDRGLQMRLLDLEASLLGTLRNFELALDRMATLSRMYREEGDLHLAGRALITEALYTFYRGDTEEAYQTIQEGLPLIDRDRDPSLVLVAAFDELLFLVDIGRYEEAKRVLFENRPQFRNQGRIAMLRLRGIEGRIDYGIGNLESAEIAFREKKAGFAEAEMVFSCALGSLQLAMTLLRQGRTAEAIKEGLESAAMFLSLDIQREILGTALFLQKAFEEGTVELATVEKAVRWLWKKMVEYGV
jgi:tetratricopeptide (TPR) repeat protein